MADKQGVDVRYPLKDLYDYIVAFSRDDLMQRIVVVNSSDTARVQHKVAVAAMIATYYPEVAKLVRQEKFEEAEQLLRGKGDGDGKLQSKELSELEQSMQEILSDRRKNSNAVEEKMMQLVTEKYSGIPEIKQFIKLLSEEKLMDKLAQVVNLFIQEKGETPLKEIINTAFKDAIVRKDKEVRMIYVNESILRKGTLEAQASDMMYSYYKSIENETFLNAIQETQRTNQAGGGAVSSLLQNVLNQAQQQRSNNLFVENFGRYISNDRLQREVPIFLHFGVPPQEDLEEIKHVNVYNRPGNAQFFFTVITDDMNTMNTLIDRTHSRELVRKVINDPFISKEEAKYFGIQHWFPGLTYAELTAKEVQESLEEGNYTIPIRIVESKMLGQGGHSAVRITPSTNIDTKELLDQFPGITEALKEENFINDPNKKGICLVGVPGTGKSTFAKVLAKETQSMLIEVDLSNLLHSLVGESEKAADKLFSFLSIVQPAIIFFDEIDKILRNSGTRDGGVSDNIKAKFLKWLDEPKEGQYVIAAANHPEMLAGELTRTGRWDSVYKVLPPPRSIREELVNRYAELYNLPYVKELVDGGEVSNGRRTKRINADLITHSDIATFYKLLREEPTSISDIKIINRLLYLSFNFEQENWMEIYERMNKLALPDIYELEDMYRMEYGIPLLFNETGSQQGNRQQIGFQQSGTFELNL